ncbi:MATE family efflux transporter [Natroniella sulfidigena]|uniref:MATE family efflux transporter n=1 Tax=Natroniella sulfidigena TaxID=723921 RepID=UPI00200B4E50|nr:MATE family efflux transporter [Natroniella sulfidigena]
MIVNSDSEQLGEEKILKLLFKLSVPSIIGMSTQALYNVVDSIYVGRSSQEALSALSLAFPIQIVLIAIAVGTGVGTSSLISRLLGEGKESRANQVAEHTIFIILIYSVIIGLVGYFYSENLISLFTSEQILIDMGKRYIRIMLIGSVALFYPMIANNILRGEGNTFAPMLGLVVGGILNIIIDPFLIFGFGIFPELGIEGAAIASIFSKFVGGVVISFILFSPKTQIKFNFKDFEFDFKIIKEIYNVGLPAMIMQLLSSIMIAIMNIIVGSFSTTAVAVAGIYFRLQSFFFMPIFGLGQAYMPILGYNYGYQKPERMKKVIRYGLIVSSVFTGVGFIVFQLFSRELILLFNDTPELLEIGVVALQRISLAFPIIGPAIIASTTFQALGKGVPSLVISFLRQIILLLPIMYLLGQFYGLDVLWFAFPISELITVILISVWLTTTLRKIFKKMKVDS